MYSQSQAAGGAPPPRYLKGRLPQGVDFAAYPGRSSTPLPTAESKSAERINQLKIWNEAATNDEKRRLNAHKGLGSAVTNSVGTRRTDSFKDAKNRHSSSFPLNADITEEVDGVAPRQPGAPPRFLRSKVGTVGGDQPVGREDIYADRSESESDDAEEDLTGVSATDTTHALTANNAHTQHSHVDVSHNSATNTSVKPQRRLDTSQHQTHNMQTKTPPQGSIPAPRESKGCCTLM